MERTKEKEPSKQARLEKRIKALASDEKWGEITELYDHLEYNNNRKHKDWRDGIDTTVINRNLNEEELSPRAKLLKLSKADDWDDIIFSKEPEDIHHLVSDESLSSALKNITQRQKQVLFLNIIKQYTTAEIGYILQTSDRNIRNIRQTAFESIRNVLGDKRGEVDWDIAIIILIWMIFWPFLIGLYVANWILPLKKRKLSSMAQ